MHYSLTNTATAPVTVLNRVPNGTSGAAVDYDPAAAYVADADGGRQVVLSQQVFARPDTDGENLETSPVTGATALAAGETLEGDVTVDRPFVRATPYDDDGDIPSDAATVRFCLGVIATPLVGGDTRTVGSSGLLVVNDDSTFERQYLFCSDPAPLD